MLALSLSDKFFAVLACSFSFSIFSFLFSIVFYFLVNENHSVSNTQWHIKFYGFTFCIVNFKYYCSLCHSCINKPSNGKTDRQKSVVVLHLLWLYCGELL